MGLQNELSDVASDSVFVIMVVLAVRSVLYLQSAFLSILRALGINSPSCPSSGDSEDEHGLGKPLHDLIGSGLAGVNILCEQMNLNGDLSTRACWSDAADRVGSDCVVCLNQICEGDHVRSLPCGHVFHKDCLDGWLNQMNLNCPLCRAPLVPAERVACERRRVAEDLLTWFAFQ
ncbi:E3 ubiquitin-protein ligase RHA2A [Striga hermonthica]|uniref:E3 ubiquitin-protein ligase RHA2A n=1 Tax=Striga hermonthica TaxID=68872 RepID=A0A9N7R9A7_STRHE|nr:E3 ubiquitin-protein ligase RHA2A [Striga hermonthica]